MRVHLVNPSDVSFGIGVITPRWLYVLAAATPAEYGDPLITDETMEQFDLERVQAGDIVGIGIHTLNACRGLEVGRAARERGAWVVFGGVHASLYPEEARELGGAHAVVKGDGDVVWSGVVADCFAGTPGRSTRAGAWQPINFFRRGGTCCRRRVTCGHRCRRFEGVPSTARSARSGAPTDSNRDSAPPIR